MSGFLIAVLAVLPVLTLVVVVHELGHFWAARAFGVKIDQFSLGFGKSVFSRRDRRGVEWRVGWLPLGGYVRFAGDQEASSSVPDADSLAEMRRNIVAREGPGAERAYFHFKPVWQRAIVVAAGPAANFVLSILIFGALFWAVGQTLVPARVASVSPNSAAAEAGFQPGDLIVSIDGERIDDTQQAMRKIALSAGTPLAVVVDRGGREVSLTATPRRELVDTGLGGEQRIGRLGVALSPSPDEVRRERYGPIESLGLGAKRTWEVLSTTVTYLGRVITGRESGDQLGGPLRIAQTSGAIAEASVAEQAPLWANALNVGVNLLQLVALLSVGIGFLNLLPIPVLDGGHLLFYAYEAVARRPLGARVQAAGYRVGLVMLLGLMVFATWNDLRQLKVFQFLGGLL
jgi:regulator of sigma E protease